MQLPLSLETAPAPLPSIPVDRVRVGLEATALARLGQDVGFRTLASRLTLELDPQRVRRRLLAEALQLSHTMAPDLHRVVRETAKILNIDAPLELYQAAGRENARIHLVRSPVLLEVQGRLLSLLDEEALRALVGHELGHFLAHGDADGGGLMRAAAQGLDEATAAPAVVEAARVHSLACELTADRFGLLACQDLSAALRLNMVCTTGLSGSDLGLDTRAYLAQSVALAFNPAGEVLALLRSAELFRLHPATGQRLAHHRLEVEVWPNAAIRLAFSPDGRFLIETDKGRIWRTDDGAVHAQVKQAWPSRFSPDGRTALLGSELWDLPEGRLRHTLPITEVWAAAFHPDGKHLFTAADPHRSIWDVATGTERQRLDARGSVVDARFLPDGRLVLALQGRVETWAEAEGTWTRQQATKTRDSGALTPDGRFLLSEVREGDSESSTTRVIDIATGRALKTPLLAGVAAHGTHLVSTWLGGKLALFADPQAEPRLFPPSVGPEAVAVSADGTRAVVRSGDDGAWLWDLTTGRPLQVKPGRYGQALAVGFVGGQARAVFRNENDDVELWDVAIPKRLKTLEKKWDGTLYAFDGDHLFIGSNPPRGLHLRSGKRHVLSQEELTRFYSQEVTDGVTSEASGCASGRPAGEGHVAVYDGRIRRCDGAGKVQWEAWPGPAGQWVTRFADGKLLRADEGAVEVRGAAGVWVPLP